MDFFVADAEGVDDGFGPQAGDLQDVVQRGLVVGVAEGVVGGGGAVPF